ncbi:toprim [Streptococcus danieliae]|uniref:Toprim n=1 Tax=Streptococcus danieliae TaxID=747656 RepID=A0A7X3KCH2_9STRE|nr:PBECR4 domain-containing protein [Streptococcus danieliae]MVX59560.1 toprim [Streptococcus danieliae]
MVEEQKQVVSSRAKSRRERVEHARSRDILDVAHELNMELFRSGRDYRWKEHDSMVISPEKNMWNWFSKRKGGDVIALVQTMKEIGFNQAIDYLNDGRFKDFTIEERVQETFNYYLKPYEQPFEAARDYLKEQRGLSDETIDFFLEKGLLAQANAKINGSIEPVVVFKAFDFSDELVGASLQGIEENFEKWPERGYAKNIVRNSDGSTGMHVDIGQPKRLVFTESPIDLMSYYELHKEQLSDVRLVSMDGLKEAVVGHHLAQLQSDLSGRPLKWTHEQLAKGLETAIANDFFADGKHADWITLAVDNDTGGQQFVRSLREKGALLTTDLPDLQTGQEKSDWNDILRNPSVDNSRLARSKRKLERLNQEFAEATEAVYSHSARANGQPMNDKRGGAAYFKRQNQLEEKVFTKLDEIKKQEERVERLQWQQELKEQGLNRQGTGLEMSVRNIPRIREELEKAERGESFYTKATLKRYRQELTRLEGIAEQLSNTSIQSGAQALVDEGRLNQWAKQPNIYFVKGLRKVALELGEDGLFVESTKYRPRTDKEKDEVAGLLAKQSEVVPESQTESLQEEVDAYITSITQDDSSYYLWQDEELLDLGADDAILEDFHSLLEDQQYQIDGVPLYVEESANDGATGYLSIDGTVLDGDGIRDYLAEQNFSEQRSVEFLTKLEDELPEIWEDVLEHYNQAAEKIIEKYKLGEQQDPSISQVKTYDEVKQENKQLAKRIEERIKAGELTISFDTDVYLYDVFKKLGNSHPTKYINDKRLEILTPLRPILESIDENTINLYKEKGTMEQDSLYQALKPHQRALSVDISTRFIGELAIAAYNTNRQVESLSGDHFGHYYDAQTLDSLSQSIERMLEYPLIELGAKDFNYGFVTISNVFYHYLAEQEGDLVLSRSDLDLLLARIEEQPIQIVEDNQEEVPKVPEVQEKALEQSPGQEKKTETKLGDFPETQEAAPLPEASESQPLNGLSPSQTRSQPLPHSTINEESSLELTQFRRKIDELIQDIVSLDEKGFYLEQDSELYDRGASSDEIEVFHGLIPTIENKGDSFTLTIENVSEPGFSDFLALNGDPIGETKIYDHLDKLSLQPEQQLRFLEDLKTAVSSTWNEAVTTYDKAFDEVVAMYSLEKTSKDYFVRFEFSEHDFNYQEGEIIPYETFARELYSKYHFSPAGYYKTYFEVLDANQESVSGQMRIDIGSDWDSIGFYLSEDNPHKSVLLEKDALVMKSLEEEVEVAEQKEKSLESSQETNTGGELFNRNSSSLGEDSPGSAPKPVEAKAQPNFLPSVDSYSITDDGENKENALEQVPEQEKKTEGTIEDLSGQIQKAAPLPEANKSQPLNGLSPSQTGPQSLLHFTISGEGKSITKRSYHKISEHDLMKLNRYAHNIQQIANWYLDTVADSEIIYFYQEGDVVNSVQIRFDKDKFQHLTGVFPYKEGQTAEQTVIDFAQGKGDFDSIFLANKGTAFDKLKVLPDLPAIVDASSFYFGDLSDVPKLHALDMSKAIKSKDEDIVLALRTADESTFPASLMKLREGLKIQLEESNQERIILGIYRERDGQIEQLSINEEYVKDGGKEMLSILENKQYEETTDLDKNQEQPLSLSAEVFTPVLDTAYNLGDLRNLGIEPLEKFQEAWERYYELSDAHEGDFTAVVEAADQLGLVNKESAFYRDWSQDRIYEESYHVQIQWFERWPDSPQLPFNEIDRVDYQSFAEVLYEQNKAFYELNKESTNIVQKTGNQEAYIPYTKVKFDVYAPGGKLIKEDVRYNIGDETEPISARLFSLGHRPLEEQAELAAIDEKVLAQLNLQGVNQDTTVEVLEQSPDSKEKKSALAQRVEEIIAADTDAKVEDEVIHETGDEAFDYSKASAHEISEHAFQKIREYTESPEDLFEYLDFMSKFPKLSPRNVALIQEQWPGVNAVATYNQWQEKGKVLGVGPEDVMTTKAKYTNKKTGEVKEKLHQNLSVRAGEKSKITLFRPLMVKMIPVLDEQGRQLKNDKGNLQYKKLSQATPQEKALVKEGKLPVRQFQERDLETGYPRYTKYSHLKQEQDNKASRKLS